MATCPTCTSSSPTRAWNYGQTPIYACAVCALQFADPMQGAPPEYYRSHGYEDVIAGAQTGRIHPGYRFLIEKIHDLTRRHLGSDLGSDQRRVIDIGCGSGYVLAQVVKWGFEGVGIDFAPNLVSVARDFYKVDARVVRAEDVVTENTP